MLTPGLTSCTHNIEIHLVETNESDIMGKWRPRIGSQWNDPGETTGFMNTTRRQARKPRSDRAAFSFIDRLNEIGRFFQKRSPQHQAMRRLARRLKQAGIPYALIGAMAVNAHGAERTTNDVDILLTQDGLDRFL
jgi:hypothetical protein